jgi:hypothetical protein
MKERLFKYILSKKNEMITFVTSNNNKDIEVLFDRLAFTKNDDLWALIGS